MAWWGAHQWLMCHMANKKYITLMASNIHYMGVHQSILYELLRIPFFTHQKYSRFLNQRWSHTCWMSVFMHSLICGCSWMIGARLALYINQSMSSNFVSFHTCPPSSYHAACIRFRILGFRIRSGGAFVMLGCLGFRIIITLKIIYDM